MSKPNSVSQIIGMIDLGDASPHALHEHKSAVSRKDRVCDRIGKIYCGDGEAKSDQNQRDVVVYHANLSELARHLKRETYDYQRLFDRAKSVG